jgi:DNA polymerase III gamma/tau subunit
VLEQEGISMDAELLNLIAQRSEGSYRESLMILDQIIPVNVTTIEQYNELQGEVDYGPGLIRSALGGSISALSQLESVLHYTNSSEVANRTVETLRDLMLIKGGLAIEYSGEALDSRIELAGKLDISQLLKGMKIIWELQTKLNAGDPIRGLEMAFAMLGEAYQIKNAMPAPRVAPVAAPSTSAPLSLSQLQAYKV